MHKSISSLELPRPKHTLCVLTGIASQRQFQWVSTRYVLVQKKKTKTKKMSSDYSFLISPFIIIFLWLLRVRESNMLVHVVRGFIKNEYLIIIYG